MLPKMDKKNTNTHRKHELPSECENLPKFTKKIQITEFTYSEVSDSEEEEEDLAIDKESPRSLSQSVSLTSPQISGVTSLATFNSSPTSPTVMKQPVSSPSGTPLKDSMRSASTPKR